MIQPKKRPDTPLAATPEEPVGMQQERERQVRESIKGSSLKLMQESRAKKSAEKEADKALKEATEKRAMDNLRSPNKFL